MTKELVPGSIEHFIEVVTDFASKQLDIKLREFAIQHRCGEFGKVPQMERIMVQSDIKPRILRVPGVHDCTVEKAPEANILNIGITIIPLYQDGGIYFNETKKDVENMLNKLLPRGTVFNLFCTFG